MSSKIKVGFIGYSPASVNVLKPLITELENMNEFEVYKYALSNFAEEHWNLKQVEFSDIDFKNLDYLFYNTGSGHSIETHLPKICKENNIISIHILDIFWSSLEGYNSRFPYLPDFSICITNKNKQDIIAVTGSPEYRVLDLGNPFFDRLKKYSSKKNSENINTVTFLSQCGVGGTLTEPTADLCQEALLQLKDLLDAGVIKKLKVYRHPREVMDFFNENNITVEGDNLFENMINSDLIISCGSTPHYEANIIGRDTLMYTEGINLKERIEKRKFDKQIIIDTEKEAKENIIDWFMHII